MDRIFLMQILESGDPALSKLMVFVRFEGLTIVSCGTLHCVDW
jgi:hypothetical protein